MNLCKKCAVSKDTIIYETFPFQLLLAFFWDLALLSPTTDKSSLVWVIIGTLFINAILIYSTVYITLHRKSLFQIRKMKKNPYVFLIMGVFVVCFTTILNSWLNLDGYLYYKCIRDLKEWNFSWNQLMLAGHMSQGYTIFLMIGEFLFPNRSIGVKAVHCVMALITIYCFYLIVETIVKKKDNLQVALFTAIFAFSPMFLGIIGELNTDFPTFCFFVWMICCGIRGDYIRQAGCGFLLCFSKETGCLLYGSYIIGETVFILFSERKEGLKKAIANAYNREIKLVVIGGLLWIGNYLFNMKNGGGWINNTSISGTDIGSAGTGYKHNSIAFYPSYMLQKFRQLLYMNFSWIMYGLILIAIFVIIWKGTKVLKIYVEGKEKYFLGILFSFFAFLVYNLFYITYNHYRYLIPFAFFISIGVIMALLILFRNSKIRKCITALLVCIVFASNFFTFDPIAKATFMKQGTGTGDILIPSTIYTDEYDNIMIAEKEGYSSVIINTSGMYNFQCHYMGNCFNKTLKQLKYDSDTLIVLPCEYRDAYGTTASLFGVNLTGYTDYYWDTKKNHLNLDCVEQIEQMEHNNRYQKLNYRIVYSISEISKKEMQKYKNIYYIALPFDPEFDHKKFLKGSRAEIKETVQYFGWKWDVYKIYRQ